MQRRLWQVCTFVQAHLSLYPGTEISCAGSNNDLCTVYKNIECCDESAPVTTGLLGNHQCVASMRQKMLPVRCNKIYHKVNRYRVFLTFYATTCAEKCKHQLVVATTGAFTLTSVFMYSQLKLFDYFCV